MKDKLEKTGHTRAYYRKKLVIKLSLFAFAFVTVCAIPVGLSYRIAEMTHAAKEDNSNETTSSQVVKDSGEENQENNSQEA